MDREWRGSSPASGHGGERLLLPGLRRQSAAARGPTPRLSVSAQARTATTDIRKRMHDIYEEMEQAAREGRMRIPVKFVEFRTSDAMYLFVRAAVGYSLAFIKAKLLQRCEGGGEEPVAKSPPPPGSSSVASPPQGPSTAAAAPVQQRPGREEITRAIDRQEACATDLAEAYARLVLHCSNFEHHKEDERFFECVYFFVCAVMKIGLPAEHWPAVEEEIGFLFRGAQFSTNVRLHGAAAAAVQGHRDGSVTALNGTPAPPGSAVGSMAVAVAALASPIASNGVSAIGTTAPSTSNGGEPPSPNGSSSNNNNVNSTNSSSSGGGGGGGGGVMAGGASTSTSKRIQSLSASGLKDSGAVVPGAAGRPPVDALGAATAAALPGPFLLPAPSPRCCHFTESVPVGRIVAELEAVKDRASRNIVISQAIREQIRSQRSEAQRRQLEALTSPRQHVRLAPPTAHASSATAPNVAAMLAAGLVPSSPRTRPRLSKSGALQSPRLSMRSTFTARSPAVNHLLPGADDRVRHTLEEYERGFQQARALQRQHAQTAAAATVAPATGDDEPPASSSSPQTSPPASPPQFGPRAAFDDEDGWFSLIKHTNL